MSERHRKPNRLQDYDYSQAGCYFITICVKNREYLLGKIEDSIIQLSNYGKIIEKYWKSIPVHYDNVSMDKFILMPNHLHGIIIISNENEHVVTEHCSVTGSDENYSGEEHRSITTKSTTNYGLLSKVVKSFKEVCVKSIRKEFEDHSFGFQRSFYDHIIRSEKSLFAIRKYIIDNPLRWELDENNPNNWMK